MCAATCDLNSTSVRFALSPAVCVVQKELCMRFAFLPRAQPFTSYKCPPTQLPVAGSVSLLCVCWWFCLGVNPVLVSAAKHPMMFSDQFSRSL